MYLLGYLPKENRLYLGDKELSVVSYSLLLSVLEYQTAVMRGDFDAADKILPSVPKEQRTRVAHFLEKQGFKTQALTVSTDSEHRFDLALQLKDTKTAYSLALEAQSGHKWKQLAELAMTLCQFDLAQECLHTAQDYPGLLLLATSSGNSAMVEKLGQSTQEKGINNVAFLSYFILGNKEKALQILIDTDRLPEAAFYARTYLPSEVSRVITLWKESVTAKSKSSKSAQALADPTEYENLFPGFQDALKGEEYYKKKTASQRKPKAMDYSTVVPNHDRSVIEEMEAEQAGGTFVPQSRRAVDAEDNSDEREDFEEALSSPVASQQRSGKSHQVQEDNESEEGIEEDMHNLDIDDDEALVS